MGYNKIVIIHNYIYNIPPVFEAKSLPFGSKTKMTWPKKKKKLHSQSKEY